VREGGKTGGGKEREGGGEEGGSETRRAEREPWENREHSTCHNFSLLHHILSFGIVMAEKGSSVFLKVFGNCNG
jgi:hypothetical protein